ncbi:MAG: hypothetical protein R3C44_19305 [Chloroflexota bacterium]
MLSFGILGGSFFAIDQMGPAMQVLKITPNAWAMDGFSQHCPAAAVWPIW